MQRRTVKILQYSITFLVCSALVLIYVSASGVFGKTNLGEIYTIISNGFFVIGIIASAVGLLILLSNNGAFDFLAYGFKRFFSLFKKDPTKVKFKTFYDYHQAMQEKEGRSFAFLLVNGIIFIVISIIFIAAWYSVTPQQVACLVR